MRIVIAPDKYKGSLSAVEVAHAMERGARSAGASVETVLCPMADGGDGTVDVIAGSAGARVRVASVRGPLPGQEVEARWAYLPSGLPAIEPPARHGGLLHGGEPTAVIEMAQASGYELVPADRRDPMLTSTYGTGQLMREAMDAGCRQVVVGIGGSGTVDGGTGMARALGFVFLDASGAEVRPGGAGLREVKSIDFSGMDPRIDLTRFIVACDVDNPLTGPQGAARVFGPQKGATPAQVEELATGLENIASVLLSNGVDVAGLPGGGAAGGLGAGLVAFCGAEVTGGFDLVAELTGLAGKMRGADLVLTGEGAYDGQTARGKTPAGVARLAKEAGLPALVLAGSVEGACVELPAFSVIDRPMGLDEAMERAAELVESCTRSLVRAISETAAARPAP